MLYLIGLGLNLNSISKEALEVLKKCKKVYLENYTVEFPYSSEELEKSLGKKILQADRSFVESLKIVSEASEENVALLIYGSPLTATTHITILEECKKQKVEFRVLYNASVLDAVAETGLQLYKFGKITSMPRWEAEKHFTPDSFMEIVKENSKIGAHSLILVDIGLAFSDALGELERSAKNHKIKLRSFAVCSRLGTGEGEIFYGTLKDFRGKEIRAPFCFVIPGKMHFVEEEVLKDYFI